jgi:AcrR family transcriptional regulator
MPPSEHKRNRGPSAAAENRLAILAAARRLFADRGYHVPLKAIATEAGVGQGVLYRHFPTRLSLALSVFEQNFAELERLAALPGPDAFLGLWARLLDITVSDSAFIEMAVDARRTMADYDGSARLVGLLEAPLGRARDAGLVRPDLTVDDVLVAHRMAYGIVTTSVGEADVRATIDRSLGAVLGITR